jgi:hypothetical protein
MEGFTKLPKMQCFKEGGAVKTKSMCYGGKMKNGGEVESADIAQDKKLIKKAFKQHDKAEHDKEPTEIKLRKGGRTKKECGTVKKYACGGGVYGTKKNKEDIKSIDDAKNCKPKKLAMGGKSVKKMADGGIMDAISNAGTSLKNNVMGTPEQNRIAQARMDMIAKKKAAEQAALLGGLGGNTALTQGAMAGAQNQAPAMQPAAMPMQKRGGKVKKGC